MTFVIFFLSLFMVFYVYVGYPIIAFIFSRYRSRAVEKNVWVPMVSVVIAAYNEEDAIAETVRNKLALDYPSEKLEIVVISDGSTDQTDALVSQFEEANVRLLRQEPRAGKTSALNLAIPQLKGDIVVFSDANSLYDPGALRALVANFSDPSVGYVTGKMVYTDEDGTIIGDGCSAYMKYENVLRSVETRVGSVVGVDGGIDAMRRDLYQPMNADQLPDFVQPLKVVAQGYRVVYEPEALLKEHSLKSSADEYRMRVRVSLRALWALYDMRQLMWLPQNRIFSWQLISHKLLRYICFVFLGALFLSNLALLNQGGGYALLFLLQCLFYLMVIVAPFLESKGYKLKIVTFSRYFALLNIACAHATYKFVRGQKQVLWTPRKG